MGGISYGITHGPTGSTKLQATHFHSPDSSGASGSAQALYEGRVGQAQA